MAERTLSSLTILLLGLGSQSIHAALAIDGSGQFQDQLRAALTMLAQSNDPAINQLHAQLVSAPGVVTFRQMTDDRATWSNDGDPNRGHTEPSDGGPKREGRTSPTDATIYIPQSAIVPGSERWRSGLLVHELVHGLDLATGRYNRDYAVRERRAVFLQNIWRERTAFSLRTSYHAVFPTMDYQYAKSLGLTANYLEYIFSRSDFPAPPKVTSK